MLSLLSLLLASGTVLRADTERWTPRTYPHPRRNATGCNSWEQSTLCDPDHILTDQWRAQINLNIRRQMDKLTEANVPLADKAPPECQNRTEGVTIYILLAKRIWTPNNQSITGNDLTSFGDELAQQYGLNSLPCKTFLLLIGIEAAKLAYVRTGKDLRLPVDLMQRVFHEYKLFNAKNFQAGLNKIVDEIGAQMANPFKNQTQTTTASSSLRPDNVTTTQSTGDEVADDAATTSLAEIVAGMEEKEGRNGSQVDGEAGNGTAAGNIHMGTAQWWMFLTLGTAILVTFGSLALLARQRERQQRKRTRKNKNLMVAANGRHMLETDGKRMRKKKMETEDRVEERRDGRDDVERREKETKGEEKVDEKKTEEERRKDEQQSTEDASSSSSSSSTSAFSTMSDEDEEEDEEGASDGTARIRPETDPRVRIGAAELATDVVVMKKEVEEKEDDEKGKKDG